MMRKAFSRKGLNKILEPTGYRISKFRAEPPPAHAAPLMAFQALNCLRHNARRQEHLVSLGLSIAGKTVLEVGAGPGEHTHFFIDRGCQVMVTEARAENLAVLRERYPGVTVKQLDMEKPQLEGDEKFDIVYCYGLLYHLNDPARAIQFMGERCRGMLLLETCVSFGSDLKVNIVDEDPEYPTQAISGKGCRPTRPWIFTELRKHFQFVYLTRTQPWHEEFPIDWTGAPKTELVRSVFVGSRERIANPLLAEEVLMQQCRY